MQGEQRNRDEFAVGTVVLVALVILIAGIIWGKGVRFRTDHAQYHVQFSEVYGLKEGSSVLVHGVARGKVAGISLDSNRAMVDIELERDVTLYRDARVLLFTPQLMGGRMVTIDPGNGPGRLEEGAVLAGEVPAGIGEVMAASGEVLNEVRGIVAHLNNTVAEIDTFMDIGRLGIRLESSLVDLNETTALLRDRLDRTSLSLEKGAAEIATTGGELREMVETNRPGMDNIVLRVNHVLGEVEEVTGNLKTFTEAISDTTGTVGKLVYSDSLHRQISRTLSDVDSLVSQLKKDGVKFSLF